MNKMTTWVTCKSTNFSKYILSLCSLFVQYGVIFSKIKLYWTFFTISGIIPKNGHRSSFICNLKMFIINVMQGFSFLFAIVSINFVKDWKLFQWRIILLIINYFTIQTSLHISHYIAIITFSISRCYQRRPVFNSVNKLRSIFLINSFNNLLPFWKAYFNWIQKNEYWSKHFKYQNYFLFAIFCEI